MTGQTRYRPDRRRSSDETSTAILTTATRYDLALWTIPAAFLLAFLTGRVLGVPHHAAFAGAALLCVLVLVDVIALNPPIEPPTDS